MNFENDVWGFRIFSKEDVDKYQLKNKINKWIQVRCSRSDNGMIDIWPTFFDFRSRCNKCGRFYKLYCKHCYDRFKKVNMILARFEEEYLKGINKYVKGIKKDLRKAVKHKVTDAKVLTVTLPIKKEKNVKNVKKIR